MAVKYIKKAVKTPETDDHKTQAAVQSILNDIAKRNEEALKDLNKKFDKYEGEVIVSKEKIEEAIKKVDQKTKDDVKSGSEISFKNENIGKVLIGGEYPFALIKFGEHEKNYIGEDLICDGFNIKLIKPIWLS